MKKKPDRIERLAASVVEDWKEYCEGMGGTPDGDDYLCTLIMCAIENAYMGDESYHADKLIDCLEHEGVAKWGMTTGRGKLTWESWK